MTMSANDLIYTIAQEKVFPVINGFYFFCDFNSQGCDLIDIKGYPMLVYEARLFVLGVIFFWVACKETHGSIAHRIVK